ncbi:unnamed protein product [Oreochromis niloticus]|nr:unnamed protein product [Mustela putorius furo]
MCHKEPRVDTCPGDSGGGVIAKNNKIHGRLDYVVERPAEEGLPEVIRILDDTDTQRISEAPYADDGEQEGEYPPYLPVDDEEVSEQSDDSFDWNELVEWGDWLSDDSGYDTMDERDDSPLIREHPPEPFWHDWQPPIAPGAAPIGQANAPLFPQVVVPVGDPPAAPPSAASSAAPPSAASSAAPPSAASSAAPPSAASSAAPPSAASSAAPPSAASSAAPPSAASSAAPSSAASSAAPSSAASSAAPSSAASSAAPSSAASSAPPSSAASSAAPSSSASSSAPSAAPSSGKRSREDLCPEEVSAKRCKVSDTFDAPSTSSGSFGVRRFWERPFDFSLDDSDSD